MWCPAVRFAAPRAGLRPEAGPRPHVRRQLALGDRPAARALLGLRHVLGHLQRLHRSISVTDARPGTSPARRPGPPRHPRQSASRKLQPLIGVIHQAHRRPRIARLVARPPLPPLPQRPVPALLLLIRAVRRRGPRRRGRIPARPAPEVFNLKPTSRSTCAVTRYTSASRAASSAAGKAQSSSTGGTPGTSGTAGNNHHPGPLFNYPPRALQPVPCQGTFALFAKNRPHAGRAL